jgi:hypothetical protein
VSMPAKQAGFFLHFQGSKDNYSSSFLKQAPVGWLNKSAPKASLPRGILRFMASHPPPAASPKVVERILLSACRILPPYPVLRLLLLLPALYG